MEGLDQAIDLLARVVDREARPSGRRDPEPLHENLGAMVAGAHGDRVAIEDLGDVVSVHAREVERDDSRPLVAGRGPEDT